MKDVGAGVNRDSDVISAAWPGGGMSDGVAASVSILRSLFAR